MTSCVRHMRMLGGWLMMEFLVDSTRNYLHHFVIWWVRTSEIWTYEDLLDLFIRSCWEPSHAQIAYGLLRRRPTLLRTESSSDCLDVA
jgi:hypothetical protein